MLFTNLILDENGLRRFAASDHSKAINTDLTLRLEFDAPRALFGPNAWQDVMQSAFDAADPAQYAEEFEAWGGTKDQAVAFASLARNFYTAGLPDKASRMLDLGLAKDPQNLDLLGSRLMFSTVDDGFLDKVLPTILAASEKRANTIGIALFRTAKYHQAAKVFQRITAARPNSSAAWANLANTYAALNDRRDADETFKKAIALDPFDDDLAGSYENFLNAAGAR